MSKTNVIVISKTEPTPGSSGSGAQSTDASDMSSGPYVGKFGWKPIGLLGKHVPVIYRNGTEYVSYWMLRRELYSTREIDHDKFDRAVKASQMTFSAVTVDENRLLREINSWHCDQRYGTVPRLPNLCTLEAARKFVLHYPETTPSRETPKAGTPQKKIQ